VNDSLRTFPESCQMKRINISTVKILKKIKYQMQFVLFIDQLHHANIVRTQTTHLLKYMTNHSHLTKLLLGVFLAALAACSLSQNKKSNMTDPFDYKLAWKTVDSLDRQGLPQSALDEVKKIATRANTDGKADQQVRCLIFEGKYIAQVQEDGLVKTIQLFEAEQAKAAQPKKAVIQSLLGELYAAYLNQMGWQLNQRTPRPDGEGDVLTWSADAIERRAIELYLASLQPATLLQATPHEAFEAVVMPGQNDKINDQKLSPTMYDVLMLRALNHFRDESNWLTEPTFRFNLDNPVVFDKETSFAAAAFETKDTTSNKWLAITAFRDYTKYRLAQKLPTGQDATLGLVSLQRLSFAKNNFSGSDRENRYLAALEALYQNYKNNPISTEIQYEWANQLNNTADNDPENTTKDNYKKAIEICRAAIKAFPKSAGGILCQNLLNDIESPSLNITTEEVLIPNQPALVEIKYKNLSNLYIRIVKLDSDATTNNYEDTEKRYEAYSKLAPVQSKSWQLKDIGDYRNHSTEIMLEPLPVGIYAIVSSTASDFTAKDNLHSFSLFTVSQIAPVVIDVAENQKDKTIVVDRNTGAPLAGVKADFYYYLWNSEQQRSDLNAFGFSVSDQFGNISIPDGKPENNQIAIRYSIGKDTLWGPSTYIGRNYYGQEDQITQVQFFTDRGLYRPSQTLYFKGIALKFDRERIPTIVPNASVEVALYDANSQEKAKLSFKTNEFGTFNGVFTLPSGGLTGQMSIRVINSRMEGQTYFNVEEYKRPRFEVSFEPLSGSYRLRDQVKTTGKAMNYAGNPVDGATVKFRVVRGVRYPSWGWHKMIPIVYSPEQEITNGTTTTNAEGKFEIAFTAIPDETRKDDNLIFDYRVYADVTDISGETRSTQTSVSVSEVATQIELGIQESIDIDSLRQLLLNFTNLANQPVQAQGTITFQRLDAPETAFLSRRWGMPDVWTIPSAEFRKAFPLFAYGDDEKVEKYAPKGSPIVTNFNQTGSKRLDVSRNLQPGWYEVTVLTADAFGKKIELKKRCRVWNAATEFTQPDSKILKSTVLVGQNIELVAGAPSGTYHIWTSSGAKQQETWTTASGTKGFSFPVTEADRGGAQILSFIFRNNRFYGHNHTVNVPFDNKDLKITFESFRDKLLPGQAEEWRLRITGPKKEKVAAEVVASMYDASLDQFYQFDWAASYYPNRYNYVNLYAIGMGTQNGYGFGKAAKESGAIMERFMPNLIWFNSPYVGQKLTMLDLGYGYGRVYGFMGDGGYGVIDTVVTFDPETYEETVQIVRRDARPAMPGRLKTEEGSVYMAMDAAAPVATSAVVSANAVSFVPPVIVADEKMLGGAPPKPQPAQIRRNLNETVFFFPELRTDANGDVLVKFKMNEALTRWKFQAFAHTKALEYGLVTRDVVTQKELTITANPPRFLRAGDVFEFSAKVSNLSQSAQSGKATLALVDATTLKVIEKDFSLEQQVQSFEVPAGQSKPLLWRIKVPADYVGAVTWQVWAETPNARDGEENTVPVVTNRQLVTETMPMFLRGQQTREFDFAAMRNKSTTAQPHQFTVEFTSNPVWYAVQSLPYLMEYPHECSEQIFSRYYANSLAQHITQKMPQIQRVMERWKGTDALKSNLTKNQELKSALLDETPWVLEAQSEAQQKQNIALLFDLNRMADERQRAFDILANRQMQSGGWSWFDGGQESWYITQHIAMGLAHLERLGVLSPSQDIRYIDMKNRAVAFCTREADRRYVEIQTELRANDQTKRPEVDYLDPMIVQYLYMMSFYPDAPRTQSFEFYKNLIGKHWNSKGLQEQAMLALAAHRQGPTDVAQMIIKSLRERALVNDELGMRWANNTGMFWYQHPIETQAIMIEAFDEVANDPKAVEEMRVWLLSNKRTNRWETTKATSEAIYALLLSRNGQPSTWLDNTQPVKFTLDGSPLKINELEAGTGYFKQTFAPAAIKQGMSKMSVQNPNPQVAWGGAYYQYFEDLDKIQAAKPSQGIRIVKQVMLEENSPSGPVLRLLANGNTVKVGDKLKIRLEITSDRPMEYVHLKDMRAAGTEPVNVLSRYNWQGGLGYYESTRDLATNFFMDYVPRGTFVLEYPIVVSHRGNQSVGNATIQCMYAPEFSAHSEGIRLEVK
jgi:uncharacterized protein YfaS (alpha-2-macroglobulin family)